MSESFSFCLTVQTGEQLLYDQPKKRLSDPRDQHRRHHSEMSFAIITGNSSTERDRKVIAKNKNLPLSPSELCLETFLKPVFCNNLCQNPDTQRAGRVGTAQGGPRGRATLGRTRCRHFGRLESQPLYGFPAQC